MAVEIQRIEPMSVLRVTVPILTVGVGLLWYLPAVIAELESLDRPSEIVFGPLLLGLLGLILICLAIISLALLVALYNYFARRFGGIEITVETE